MPYEKQTFKDGETVLKAEHLEHIEEGITEAIEKAETPFFDLTELGLPTLEPNSGKKQIAVNTDDIMVALGHGPVAFGMSVDFGSPNFFVGVGTTTYSGVDECFQVVMSSHYGNTKYQGVLNIVDGGIEAWCELAAPLTVDFSKLGLPSLLIGSGQSVTATISEDAMTELVGALSHGSIRIMLPAINPDGTEIMLLTTVFASYSIEFGGFDVSFIALGMVSVSVQIWPSENRIDAVSYDLLGGGTSGAALPDFEQEVF